MVGGWVRQCVDGEMEGGGSRDGVVMFAEAHGPPTPSAQPAYVPDRCRWSARKQGKEVVWIIVVVPRWGFSSLSIFFIVSRVMALWLAWQGHVDLYVKEMDGYSWWTSPMDGFFAP